MTARRKAGTSVARSVRRAVISLAEIVRCVGLTARIAAHAVLIAAPSVDHVRLIEAIVPSVRREALTVLIAVNVLRVRSIGRRRHVQCVMMSEDRQQVRDLDRLAAGPRVVRHVRTTSVAPLVIDRCESARKAPLSGPNVESV